VLLTHGKSFINGFYAVELPVTSLTDFKLVKIYFPNLNLIISRNFFFKPSLASSYSELVQIKMAKNIIRVTDLQCESSDLRRILSQGLQINNFFFSGAEFQ
jgi:hypothetical protein